MNEIDVIASEEYINYVKYRNSIDLNMLQWWKNVMKTIGPCEYLPDDVPFEEDRCLKHNAPAVCPVNMMSLLMGHVDHDGSPKGHEDTGTYS